MIVKLLGSGVVILCSTLIGFNKANYLGKRPQEIRELISYLTILETEISYGAKPLTDAFDYIAEGNSGVVSSLFEDWSKELNKLDGKSTKDCFTKVIKDKWGDTNLGAQELKILQNLSASLGMSSIEDQKKHISLAKINLKEEETKASEQFQKHGKMYKTLGVLLGALIVILLY